MVEIISKEQIAKLPIEVFEGQIVVVDTIELVNEAISCLEKFPYIGFDSETRPAFVKGKSHKISLIQLATPDKCFLFRLNKIDIPDRLFGLLSNTNTIKIGLSLKDDFSAIRKRIPHFKSESFIELQVVAKKAGIKETGLQRIYAILFNKRITKSQRLSNWEAEQLTDAQKMYASIDAWACLRIYKKLISLKKAESEL